MQVILEVPETLGAAIQKSPQKAIEILNNVFVEEQETSPMKEQTKPQTSKWARMVEEVENNPELDLAGYSEQIKKDVRAFRDNFEFGSERP